MEFLVDNPDELQVRKILDERGVLIEIQVSQADMGQIVGRQGETARAIRTLLRLMGAKENARVAMKILEPDHGAD